MKFTLNWLKEHLETAASLDDVVEALTRVGLEVEGVENPGEKLAAFRVARVLTAERHPQADKLQVLTVDTGEGAPLQVVCGAPNARAGLVGVLGLPGAVVPANGMQLKVAAVRGVESNGMMCSTRELELGDDHEGIIELPADAPIGMSYPDYAGLERCRDRRFDHAQPAGLHGRARHRARSRGGGAGHAQAARRWIRCRRRAPGPEVRIEAPEGCPAYFGQTVSGVHQRRFARLDAAAPQGDRPAADLGAGRHHQLCDDRSRPSAARL